MVQGPLPTVGKPEVTTAHPEHAGPGCGLTQLSSDPIVALFMH